ncbi:MAG TPA: ATP-binding protein [Bryobacteraceae bacterium]|nr:ATP-binding protein [Bryobacteraceae bacterium]
MNWTAQQRINRGFWLLAAVPFLLGLMAYRNSRSLIESADDVARTNQVVRRLEILLSNLKDVQVAQREFIITGEESYLAPIQGKLAAVDADIKQLKVLTTENEDQRYNIKLLEPIIPQKFEELQKTIELRKSEGVEAVSRVLLSNRGAQAMDDIARVIQMMIRVENRLLAERTQAQRQNFVSTMLLFGAVLLMNSVSIWIIWVSVRRETAERRREEERIRQINADLERRVAQRTEALQRSNEDLQQFAYVASHDLQEPLRMVGTYTELLQRRYKGKLDQDADMFIGYAVEGVKRMNLLIKDLLDYSRANEDPEESVSPVDPEIVLKNVLSNLKVTIAEAKAAVTHDPLPAVVYDSVRLGQIFQNLIGNALKYRGERNPDIHIGAEKKDGEVVFSVRDNGIGIDPQHHDEIFGIFKRLHKKEFEGTGLGLSMCKKIAERHGGRIWVESKPGLGSVFFFTIPDRTGGKAKSAGE